jgi:hypothetical protein
MPARRSTQTTPDLFSAEPPARAPEPPAVPQAKAKPDNLASQPRHFLPKNLAEALKRLDNAEIDALLAGVTTEAKRRTAAEPGERATNAPGLRRGWRGFVDIGQAERSACGIQGRRKAFSDCAAVRDFTV